jgi:hypothetical protein
MTRPPRPAPLAQGIFYVATGLWPIFHMRSFEAVTGAKTDRWLVRTTGGLLAAVGAALIAGALDRRVGSSRALRVLGIGSAVVLGAADVIYASRGRISKIYLADAAAEGAVVASWIATN